MLMQPGARTLHGLIALLRRARSRAAYERVLRAADLSSEELAAAATWNGRHYTRNCLLRTESFELMLICFEPGQSTSIHDYGGEEGWVKPVQGELIEERFKVNPDDTLVCTEERRITGDEVSHLPKGASIHRFTNPLPMRVMSLNLYARPLRSWNVYDKRKGHGRQRILNPAGRR
ncbi:MAG: cysteine dioxygenase family protein [Flavobacteriales bacterium]|nr:cysteine dioxygenase family protein [Flavobacteriales bacterium]